MGLGEFSAGNSRAPSDSRVREVFSLLSPTDLNKWPHKNPECRGPMNTVVKIQPKDVESIAFQEASLDIWDKKYRLTAKDGSPVDKTMDDTYKRVARALADTERED